MKKSLLVVIFVIGVTSLFCCSTHKQAAKTTGSDQSITEKYWKLTELNGKPVSPDSGYSNEPHMIFKANDSIISGNGGCNNFHGAYKVSNNFNLRLSKIAATQMACANMTVESQFFQVLEMVDSYYIKGDSLIFNRARMAPLARFIAVYKK